MSKTRVFDMWRDADYTGSRTGNGGQKPLGDNEMTQNQALRSGLNAVIGEVAAEYHERDEETRMITLGFLARQHTLLLGPPGTGKSALVRELTSRLEGGTYWEILMSKFTAPTAIFGPIDVGALAQGTYRQLLDGHAT